MKKPKKPTMPVRDPERAYVRRKTAARKVGRRRCATCGECRPQALLPDTDHIVCAACDRSQRGHSIMDELHVGGAVNSSVTLLVHVNDHRAELTELQNDWLEKTRENPDGSPALAAAGCIRGFVDTVVYLIKKCVLWVADLLEAADAFLVAAVDRFWWAQTDLSKIVPTE